MSTVPGSASPVTRGELTSDPDLPRLGSIRVIESDRQVPGYYALMRGCDVVWQGPIGTPLTGFDFDGMVLHPVDVERLRDAAQSSRQTISKPSRSDMKNSLAR